MGRPRVHDPADRRLHTYVPETVATAVGELAVAEGISNAAVLRRALITDLTRRSRLAQGLPEHVADPATLARVAELLEVDR